MSNTMVVLLNGITQLEFHRDKALPVHQAQYLDKMDQKMDLGIELDQEQISNPDLGQRSRFVAANLLNAILQDQQTMAASLCSYLAMRLPELKQVKFTEQNHGQFLVDLVFDEAYRQEIPVQFTH